MKKLLTIVLVLGIVVCSVFANGGREAATSANGVVAGSNKSASGETTKDVYIDFWGVWSQDNYRAVYWQEKAAEFCEQYEKENGISVQIDYFGQGSYASLSEKLAAGAVAKLLPVISQVEEQVTARFASLGADLAKYLAPEVIDNYLDGILVSCTQKGKLVAVPAGRSYVCCILNKDLLEKSGHTLAEVENWDWDKYIEIATDISKIGDDIYGAAVYWDEDAWTWESALYSEGGSIDNEDGTKITFLESDSTRILNNTVKMLLDKVTYSAYSDYSYMDVTDGIYELWAQGKLGSFIGSITMYKSSNKFKTGYEGHADFDVVIAKQPAGSAGFGMATGGSNMMILNSATETQKKVAAAFFEYLAQDANVAAWNQVSGYEAFTESVVNDDSFKAAISADPNLLNIYKFVEDAHSRPTTPKWQEMYSTVIIHDLVDLTQHPENYADPKATQALVEKWAEKCQKILDEK